MKQLSLKINLAATFLSIPDPELCVSCMIIAGISVYFMSCLTWAAVHAAGIDRVDRTNLTSSDLMLYDGLTALTRCCQVPAGLLGFYVKNMTVKKSSDTKNTYCTEGTVNIC